MKVFVSQRIFPEALDLLKNAGLQVEIHDATRPLLQSELNRKTRAKITSMFFK